MEHLIVSGQGAGDAVAFGRGRIAYLKTLGLAYASQTIEFDSWQITVKITPGHEYIIVEGGCVLSMDSGVVDLRSVVLWFDAFGLPGLRRATVVTAANEVQMTKPTAGGSMDQSVRPLLSGPGIAGRVIWGGAKNRGSVTLPGDIARSFMPVVQRPNPDAAWTFVAMDENLIAKKLAGLTCPPSMFTGRCRDWVQAVMGRFLYDDWHRSNTVVAPMSLRLQIGAPPELTVEFHKSGRSSSPTPPVRLTVSSGVHRDAEGRHWLFLPGIGDTVDVFQLRSNECGEQLRKALEPNPPAWAQQLSAADRDLIERYILAYSLPVQDTWQALAVPGARHSADAMGYGWHWNRTGLAADRVIHDQFRQGPSSTPGQDNWAMRSRHQRLSMYRAPEGRWQALVSQVAGPYDWAVERGLCVILEPWWGIEGGSWKTTPEYTEMFAYQPATFYVWYRGDTLLTANVSVEQVLDEPAKSRATPTDFEDFFTDDLGQIQGLNRGRTVGARGGRAEIVQKIFKHWRYKVTVAGSTFTMQPGKQETGKWFEIPAKTELPPDPTGPISWDGSTPGWSTGLTWESYYEGYPPYSYYERRRADNESIAGYAYQRRVLFRYTVDQFAFTRNHPGRIVIAAARNDAEAVYAKGEESTVQVNAAYTRGQNQSRNYALVYSFAFRINGGPTSYGPDHIQYMEGVMQNDQGDGPGIPVPSQTINTPGSALSLVVTRCEDVSANPGDWDLSPTVWFRTEDLTTETFFTLTSAMGKVAITDPRFCAPVGVSGDIPEAPLIVGAT